MSRRAGDSSNRSRPDRDGRIARIAPKIADRVAVATVVGVVHRETHGQVGSKLGLKLETARDGLFVLGAVAQIAIVVRCAQRQAQRAVFTERSVDRAFGVDRIVVAVGARKISRELAQLGLLRQDVDRAAGRIAAIEDALRALEHLDPSEVVKYAGATGGTPDIDPIVVERDRGVAQRHDVEIAHPAKEDQVARAAGLDLQRRGELIEPIELSNPSRRERCAVDHRERHRGLLRAFLAPLRGNDDLAEAFLGCIGTSSILGRSGSVGNGLRHRR